MSTVAAYCHRGDTYCPDCAGSMFGAPVPHMCPHMKPIERLFSANQELVDKGFDCVICKQHFDVIPTWEDKVDAGS